MTEAEKLLYLGETQFLIFGEIDEAEGNFKKGLALAPSNIRLLLVLNNLYVEKDKRLINPTLNTYSERLKNLKTAEKIKINEANRKEVLQYLSELYLIEEQFDNAQKIIDEYCKQDTITTKIHELQARIYIKKEKYDKAIKHYKEAIKLDPYNFALWNNLANVYIMNKEYIKGEETYIRVIKHDSNNVDAYIGLGELRLNSSSDDPSEEDLKDAERFFNKAKELGFTDKGSKRLDLYEPGKIKFINYSIEKRKYKSLLLSDINYSLGYINVKLFEKNKFNTRHNYLEKGKSYFTRSLYCNEDNLKAKHALEKIKNYNDEVSSLRNPEKIGGYLVVIISLTVFLLCQYFFLLKTSSPGYTLDDQQITYISKAIAIGLDSTQQLNNLSGIKFIDKQSLLEAIKESVGKEKYDLNISKITSVIMPLEHEVELSINYLLITFGSIIFIIAGLYLPQLLRLRLGAIELEKNSPSEINTTSMLNIQK